MMECNEICKYYNREDGCVYGFMGSGIPKYAPCFPRENYAEWKEMRVSNNMLICSNCGVAFNKTLIYDHTEKDPLAFRYCPNCGADMRGKV